VGGDTARTVDVLVELKEGAIKGVASAAIQSLEITGSKARVRLWMPSSTGVAFEVHTDAPPSAPYRVVLLGAALWIAPAQWSLPCAEDTQLPALLPASSQWLEPAHIRAVPSEAASTPAPANMAMTFADAKIAQRAPTSTSVDLPALRLSVYGVRGLAACAMLVVVVLMLALRRRR